MMSEQETDPTDEDIIEDDESIVDDNDEILIDDNVEDIDNLDSSDDEYEDELESQANLSDDEQYEDELASLSDDQEYEYEDELESQANLSDDEQYARPSQYVRSDELDIDAALAAVSQLTLLTQDDTDDAEEDIEDGEYYPVAEDTIAEFTREPHREATYDFEQPRDLSMSRGQMASVIPALSLIILGGWLTFTLTTSTIQPSAGLLFAVVLIAVGAIFLSQWLTSARWSRGNFFFGSSALMIGGIQLYFSQVSPDTVSNGWSLWIVSLGIALFGTGYIAVPRLQRLSIMGFITIIAGAIGYILTSGTLDPSLITFVSNLWFVGVAIIVFMMVAPLIRRRQ